MNLLDLPERIPAYLEENIVKQLRQEIAEHETGRKNDVARGAETPELAALLFDKHCSGLLKAAWIIGINTGDLQRDVDRIAREIDPNFDATREARWKARPAALSIQGFTTEFVDCR